MSTKKLLKFKTYIVNTKKYERSFSHRNILKIVSMDVHRENIEKLKPKCKIDFL